MPDLPTPSLLSLASMARRLRVTVAWLRTEADADRVPCLCAGRRYLFAPAALVDTLARRAAERCDDTEGWPMHSTYPIAAPATPGIAPELFTTAQVAALCGIGERSPWRWSRSGASPRPVEIGGAVRYRRAEPLAWVEAKCQRIGARGG